jgi:hypothetical protein
MKLAELEHYFASAATSGQGPSVGLEEVFRSSESLSASARLAIYNRGYYYRLLDALSSVFGQTRRVLGDAEFDRVALAYLARHPSEQPAVERVGRLFSSHLRSLESLAEPAAALAELEWARLCALVAPNPKGLARAESVSPSQFPHARLRFVPSLICFELDPRALQAFAGRDFGSAARGQAPESVGVAIFRARHAVAHQSLDRLEFRALRAALDDSSMAQVCALFDTGAEADDAQRAFRVVATWFAREWIESLAL